MDHELRVEAGAVTVLRLFDVAYAIDLARVEALGAAQAPEVSRLRLTRAEPKAMTFGAAPVEIGLGAVSLPTTDAGQARSLYTLVADITETTERVDNALKVTEDVYLARIYGAALDLFRVRSWDAAVQHKLAIIRDTYTALYDEAASARAELLEVAIVVLIVIELVVALLRH